jgi:tetratricopeptide (TPR) repeat protein
MDERLKPKSDDTGRTLGWKLMLESAKVALAKGDTGQAEKLFNRALETAERRLGQNDVILAHILMEMAEFHLNQQNHELAYECYLKVRKILAEHANTVHPALT